MDVINNSTIDTVIDFANVKFGMELTSEDIVEQLKALSFSQTLRLLSSMKNDEPEEFSEIIDLSAMNEAGYGGAGTANPSRATIRAGSGDVENRRANNIAPDQNRDSRIASRTVAGASKTATGQGANRASPNDDPDDVQRGQNAQQGAENANQAAYNAQEIERLKQLAGAR